MAQNLSLYSLSLLERFRLWSSLELPYQLGIVQNLFLYSLSLLERFRLWSSLELPYQLGIVQNLSLSLSCSCERFRFRSSLELPYQIGIVQNLSLYSLSLPLDLMKALVSDTHNKGKQSIITGYNHIDSVDECAPAISIGYVFLQLRYVIVGGKLVPLGGGGDPVE